MSITTYEELIATPNSKKRALVEIEPSQQLIIWTNYSGNIYYTEIDPIHVLSIYEDGTALTEVSSLAAVSAGEWYYDDANNYIYIEMSGSDSPYQHEIVANYRFYTCNDVDEQGGVIFNDRYYEPLLLTIPVISQKKMDAFWGISITSGGNASYANADQGNGEGYFDTIYNSYAWNNKPITIRWGGEDLPYSEYKKAFKGIIDSKDWGTGTFEISFIDSKDKWDTVIPLNSYDQTVYPNLADEDVGKAIPWAWGIVSKQPVVCITRGAGTATSIHKFKMADTSLHSIVSIDRVRVNGRNKNHHSGDIAAATFKLSSTIYTPGDEVTVDFHAYESGTIIENPVSITKEIGEQIGETYTSTIWNQTDISTAIIDADEFPVGVSITEFRQAIDVVAEIMQSCLGTFYIDNDGLYNVSIWSPDLESDMDSINEDDILEGSLNASSLKDDIRKTIKIGWKKNFDKGTYAYKSQSNTITELLYGITKNRTIPTLLSNSDSVDIYLDRISLLNKNATINISFTSKLQFSLKNIGDRATIAFKRIAEANNIPWMDIATIEIKEITKDFQNNTLTITVDNLKGIGAEVGNWTADAVYFLAELGGGSGDTWDPTWSAEKKAYALQNWGYWTDDDGFIDSSDSTTWNKSIWW